MRQRQATERERECDSLSPLCPLGIGCPRCNNCEATLGEASRGEARRATPSVAETCHNEAQREQHEAPSAANRSVATCERLPCNMLHVSMLQHATDCPISKLLTQLLLQATPTKLMAHFPFLCLSPTLFLSLSLCHSLSLSVCLSLSLCLSTRQIS